MKLDSDKIAIIGMSCYFPSAPDIHRFYQNILSGQVFTGTFPIEKRWGPEVYVPGHAPSMFHTYCNQGGAIDYDVYFDPIEYTIPPNELLELDPDQLMSVNLTRAALADAGIDINMKQLDRISCGVVLGKVTHVGPAAARSLDLIRVLPQIKNLLRELVPSMDTATLAEFERRFLQQRNDFKNTRGISAMSNLLASRVADRLNLVGPSYIVDGACASSLIALQHAIRELRLGHAEIMAAGGVMFPIPSGYWKGFSYLGGLSRKGSISAFDKNADGIVLGEGGGIVILKPLEKALRDGNRVYAVIEALECNNDGRGNGILAPSQAGQERVIRSTWEQTEFSPQQLSMIECHGTGMPLGDKTELASMTATLGASLDKASPLLIGSVKSQIGHTLSASGIASIIKSSLSLYHRTLPPVSNCAQPLEALADSPFRVSQTPEPVAGEHTLLAAVNAFGFGGVNSHAILSSVHHAKEANNNVAAPTNARSKDTMTQWSTATAAWAPKGAQVVLQADSAQTLLDMLERTKRGERIEFSTQAQGRYRLIIDTCTESSLKHAKKVIAEGKRSQGMHGVFYQFDGLFFQQPQAKIALVYPGISYFDPEFESLIEQYQIDVGDFLALSKHRADAVENRGSSGMLLSYVLSEVLRKEGLHAHAVAGSSLGEFSAMIGAGVITGKEILQFVDAFEAHYNEISLLNQSFSMISLSNISVERLQALIADLDDVYIALINSSRSLVLVTHERQKPILTERFKKEKILFFDIGVNAVSHTILNKPVLDALKPLINDIKLMQPQMEVWSSITASPCSSDIETLRDIIYRNLFSQVNFAQLTRRMHEAGYRVFMQCGMGGASGYIKETLSEHKHLTIDLVSKQQPLEQTMRQAFWQLWIEGYQPGEKQAVQPKTVNLAMDDAATKTQKVIAKTAVKLTDYVSEYFPAQELVQGLPICGMHMTNQQDAYLAKALIPSGGQELGQMPFDLTGLDKASPYAGHFQQILASGQQAMQQAQAEVMQLYLSQVSTQSIAGHMPMHTSQVTPAPVTPTLSNTAEHVPVKPAVTPAYIEHTQTEHFDFERYPSFKDHEILKHPDSLPDKFRSAVVPMSAMIFRACEAVHALFPHLSVYCVHKMHAKKFISMKEPCTVETRYKQISEWLVEVEWLEHFSCQVELTASVVKQAYQPEQWQVTQAYRREGIGHYTSGILFHGEKFRGLVSVEGITAEQAILGTIQSPGGYSALLDSCFHLSACWYDQLSGDNSSLILPLGIDTLEFTCDSRDFINDKHPQGKCVLFNPTITDMLFTWDADYYHGDALILKIRGFKDFKFESSLQLQKVYEMPESMHSRVSKALLPNVYLYEAEVTTTWSWDLLRTSYLCAQEREDHENIKLFPDRTAHVCGRVAAKDAYRDHWGQDLHLATVEIRHHANGAPYFYHPGYEGELPICSISHKKRLGACLLGKTGESVGIDVEMIADAKNLGGGLVFNAADQTLIAQSQHPEHIKTMLWSAKEAFIKSSQARYQTYATRFAEITLSQLAPAELKLNYDKPYQAYQALIQTPSMPSPSAVHFVVVDDSFVIAWIHETTQER